MMTGYPYVSIMVTGCLHCFLGFTVCIISILCIDPYTKEFIAGTLISGFWLSFFHPTHEQRKESDLNIMMTGYPYVSIMVTGCLHCFLGFTVCIISILCIDPYTKEFIAGTLISGFWMLMLGTLGIEAGVQQVEVEKIQELISMAGGLDIIVGWEKFTDRKKRQLKIVYMVTSILSACVFSGLACGLYTGVIPVSFEKAKSDSYVAIGGSGIVFAILEFILAMVSFILCCCFSPTTSNTTDTFQAPPQKIVTTVPGQSTIHYQYPPNTKMEYLPPPNTTMQYEPSGYRTVSSQPLVNQQHADPIKPQ